MLLEDLVNALKDMFFSFLYLCFAGTAKLIDFIKNIFYMLCGIDPVSLNGEDTDLLSALVQSGAVKRSFLMIFLIGVILLAVFTVVGILKSYHDEKTNVWTVLKRCGQSFITAVVIPFVVLAAIALTNTVMCSVNSAMNQYGSDSSTIGGQFLATIGADCYIGSEDKETVLAAFVSGKLDYGDINLVKGYFNIQSMNYVIAILGTLVMLVMFVLSSITFVQRIFDVILLYLVSPISISTIPLDGGDRFGKWKDMMIGKVLSAYGVILTMNLFFLIIPTVYKVRFFQSDFENGVVYVLFLIGGSFAITKSNDIIAGLCGSQASGHELASMLYNARSAMFFAGSANRLFKKSAGKLIGGNAYNKSRAKGNSRKQSLKTSASSNVNGHKVDPKKQAAMTKQAPPVKALRAATSLATMPLGMVHDLAQGGLIGMGKNFMPRLRNVISGSTVGNRADYKQKPKKPDNPRTESGGGSPQSEKKRAKPNSVMRKDNSESRSIKGRKR